MLLHTKHVFMLFLVCFVAFVLGVDSEDHEDLVNTAAPSLLQRKLTIGQDKAAVIAADQVSDHVVSLSTSFLTQSATETSFPGDFPDNLADDGNDVEGFTFSHDAEVPTWITCDSKGAPLAKAGVQIEWIDPFCKAVGDHQFSNFSVTDAHKDSGITIVSLLYLVFSLALPLTHCSTEAQAWSQDPKLLLHAR